MANYGPWAKYSPLPIFLNKVLLEHGVAICLLISYGWFKLQWQSRVMPQKTVWSAKPKIVPIWPFEEKFTEPCARVWRERVAKNKPNLWPQNAYRLTGETARKQVAVQTNSKLYTMWVLWKGSPECHVGNRRTRAAIHFMLSHFSESSPTLA